MVNSPIVQTLVDSVGAGVGHGPLLACLPRKI